MDKIPCPHCECNSHICCNCGEFKDIEKLLALNKLLNPIMAKDVDHNMLVSTLRTVKSIFAIMGIEAGKDSFNYLSKILISTIVFCPADERESIHEKIEQLKIDIEEAWKAKNQIYG